MSRASLLRVRATNNLRPYVFNSVRLYSCQFSNPGTFRLKIRTVVDGLLCVKPVLQSQHVIAPKPQIAAQQLINATYVPCFPVKPWKMTLVSPLIRRFSIVAA